MADIRISLQQLRVGPVGGGLDVQAVDVDGLDVGPAVPGGFCHGKQPDFDLFGL